METIGQNCWTLIANELRPLDMLNLRATCKYMNNIIKKMNSRWYRSYQWYLTRKCDKKVKCAHVAHWDCVTADCIPDNNPILLSLLEKDTNLHIMVAKKRMITAKLFTVANINECVDKFHLRTIYPKSESEIPLTGCDPKRIYMYHYLIECYREKHSQHQTKLLKFPEQIKKAEQDIEYMFSRLQRDQKRLEVMRVKFDVLQKQYANNHIFEGTNIARYKGV